MPDPTMHSLAEDPAILNQEPGTRNQEPPPGLPSADELRARLAKQSATPAQIETVVWMLEHGRRRGWKFHGEFGKVLACSASTVSKIFSGRYSPLESAQRWIDSYRGQIGANTPADGHAFIPLRISAEIGAWCEMVRSARQLGVLVGDSQFGKTWALRYHASVPRPARTLYLELPPGGGKTKTLKRLAEVAGVSQHVSSAQMEGAIFDSLRGDPEVLLLADEVTQAFPLVGEVRLGTIELFRRIHDECGIAVVLSATKIIIDMFEEPRLKLFLGQTSRRGHFCRKVIPDKPYKADVSALCLGYGLPACCPKGMIAVVESIATTHGIGPLCDLLQLATNYARNKREPLAWQHVRTTLDSMEAQASGKRGGNDASELTEEGAIEA